MLPNIIQAIEAGKPVLVKVSTPNCGPCKVYGPVFDSTDTPGVLKFHADLMDEETFRWFRKYSNALQVPRTLGFSDYKYKFDVQGPLKADTLKELGAQLILNDADL